MKNVTSGSGVNAEEPLHSGVMYSDFSLDVRVGVTGHRNLTKTPELIESIRQALSEFVPELLEPTSTYRRIIKRIIPRSQHTSKKSYKTKLTFTLVSPLAEGADRFVAEEALKLPDYSLVAALPMLKEEYIQDFQTPESRAAFEHLLGQAIRCDSVINQSLKEEFPTKDPKIQRKEAYKKGGEYVVNHCDILLALWDGQPARGIGGTEEIVAFARKKKKSLIIISTVNPDEISVERGDGSIGKTFSRMEMFNSFKINQLENNAYIESQYRDIFSTEEGKILNPKNMEIVKNHLLPWYVRASIIAKKNQKIYLRAGLLVYSLTPVAVAAVAFGTLVHHLSGYFFLSEFIILSGILLIVLLADRCKAQKKWTQTRYLAEGIRSSIYLCASGFRPLPISVPHHLRIAHRPDDWMVRVFDQILGRLPDVQKCTDIEWKASFNFIKTQWIIDQKDFHINKSNNAGKKGRKYEQYGKIIFGIAVIAAGLHTVLYITGYEFEMEWISVYIIFAAIALPTFGSSLGAIRTHREYSRLAKRSQNMADSLDELLEDYEKIKSLNELKTLVDKTHELMLREAQDWLGLMKFPKVEPL